MSSPSPDPSLLDALTGTAELPALDFTRRVRARTGPADAIIEIENQGTLRLDYEGRWCSFLKRNRLFQRLMDGEAVENLRSPCGPARLDNPGPLHEEVRRWAGYLGQAIRRGICRPHFASQKPSAPSRSPLSCLSAKDGSEGQAGVRLLACLDLAQAWTAERYRGQTESYRRAYPAPLSILPPDRYRDLIVMPTAGCPNGTCPFCAFYRDQPFRILSEEDYGKHLAAVQDLFGRAADLRQGIFLGAANALAMPQPRMVTALRQTLAVFGERPRGLAAFWDPHHAPHRSQTDWATLAFHGLRRVFIGLETGSPPLRSHLGKSPDIPGLLAAIRELRRGGISAGILVLAGPGGNQAAQEHLHGTVESVRRMELDAKDILYVSPLQGALPKKNLMEQASELIEALRKDSEAPVAPYRMELFRYYA